MDSIETTNLLQAALSIIQTQQETIQSLVLQNQILSHSYLSTEPGAQVEGTYPSVEDEENEYEEKEEIDIIPEFSELDTEVLEDIPEFEGAT